MFKKIINTGSQGNCFIYDKLMIDCGVPYKDIKKYLKDIKCIFITHIHSDHMNIATIKNIYLYYPNIIIIGNKEVHEQLKKNDVNIVKLELNEEIKIEYDFKQLLLTPVHLYHDVLNCGLLIKYEYFLEEFYIFYGTDTHTLENIKLPKCKEIYLECNYEEKTLLNNRENILKSGGFDYTQRVEFTHLSLLQWLDFCLKFLDEKGVAYAMHQSTNNSPLNKVDYSMKELKILEKIYGE